MSDSTTGGPPRDENDPLNGSTPSEPGAWTPEGAAGPGSEPNAFPPAGAYPPPGGQPASGSYPPPGGYPPAGSYPSAGGYGQPPGGGGYPPSGPAPYGPPGGQPVAVGEAFNYGWTKFTQNLGPILLAALGYVAVAIVIGLVWNLVLGALGLTVQTDSSGNATGLSSAGAFGGLFAFGLLALVNVVVGYVIQAGIIRGGLEISYGRPLSVSTFFQFHDLGRVILASLLVSVLTAVGFVLCYVPGVIVGFFSQFVLLFVVDKGLGPVDAIKASFALVNRNLGTVVVFYLATILVAVIGLLVCLVGILAAFPVIVIAQVYLYRRLQGEQVAA